jgi:hypothetical protein
MSRSINIGFIRNIFDNWLSLYIFQPILGEDGCGIKLELQYTKQFLCIHIYCIVTDMSLGTHQVTINEGF